MNSSGKRKKKLPLVLDGHKFTAGGRPLFLSRSEVESPDLDLAPL